jgi:threonine/homoserine/homoserine lactone efflux protein
MPDLLIIPLGLAIGILVSAPVGPVNIICINRTLHHGFLQGLVVGLGAAAADGVLAAIAGLGFTTISDLIADHDRFIQMVGGSILVVFGMAVMTSPPPKEGDRRLERKPPLRSAAGTFLITITNPGAVLGMLAIFGGIIGGPMVADGDYAAAGLLVVSVVGGALVWWTGISALVARLRHHFSPRTFRTINIVSGIALMCFGAILLIRLAMIYVL